MTMNAQRAPQADGVAQARNLLAEAAQEVDRLEIVAGQAFRRLTALTGMLARLERLAGSHEPKAVEAAAFDAATVCHEAEVLVRYINSREWGLCSLRNLVRFLMLNLMTFDVLDAAK
jgi:hypothetical protein